MLFPKSKIQKTEYEDARKKRDRDHMGQIVLLVKKLKRLCYITYARSPRPTTYRSLAAATILHAPMQIKRDQCICMQRNASSERRPPHADYLQMCVRRCMRAFFPCARHGGNFKPFPVQVPLPELDPTAGEAPRDPEPPQPDPMQQSVVDACASFHKSLEEGACFQGFNNSWLYAFIVLLSVLNNGIKKKCT